MAECDDDLWPHRWLIWWHGSGPQRGTHVMELAKNDLGYSGEIAYLGDSEEAKAGAEKLVANHNLIVDRLRAALKLAEICHQ